MTTIRGWNLGALGDSSHIDYIYLIHPVRGTVMECLDPVVVVDNREVNCTVPAGFGGGWNISMSIMGQPDDGSGVAMWQYEAPVVTRVSPRFAGPGTTIFIEVRSFFLLLLLLKTPDCASRCRIEQREHGGRATDLIFRRCCRGPALVWTASTSRPSLSVLETPQRAWGCLAIRHVSA